MITYKSYEDIQPMVVTMDKIKYYAPYSTAWIYIDDEPAFEVNIKQGTEYEFTIDHFDEPEAYQKLLLAMNEPSHLHELLWGLFDKENDADRKLMVFNQGNILIKGNNNE